MSSWRIVFLCGGGLFSCVFIDFRSRSVLEGVLLEILIRCVVVEEIGGEEVRRIARVQVLIIRISRVRRVKGQLKDIVLTIRLILKGEAVCGRPMIIRDEDQQYCVYGANRSVFPTCFRTPLRTPSSPAERRRSRFSPRPPRNPWRNWC